MKSLNLTKKTITVTLAAFTLLWMQNAIAGGDLSSMRIGQVKDKTRVVFDLTKAQTYKVTELANPARIVVDFYNTDNSLSFKKKIITDSRLFKIRVSDNRKRVRVVLDLHKSPEYKAFMLDDKRNKSRLVVDLTDKHRKNISHVAVKKTVKPVSHVKVAKASIAVKPSNKANLANSNSKPQQTSQKALIEHSNQNKSVVNTTNKKVVPLVKLAKVNKSGQALKLSKPDNVIDENTQRLLNKESAILAASQEFIVAIDAGHGGKDTGAIGYNHIYEKDATLKMAKELKKIIDSQPGMHAVLTRDRDIFIPLSKRVKIAKEKNADLFISIHADAFHDHSVRGGSVYVLSERGASSTMAKLLARSENASLQDVSLDGMDQDVAFALSDLSREANVKSSRKLASTVLKEMQKKVKMHKHSVQSAGFAVLKSIDMPSLLIETAFISNPHEARNLMSHGFRVKMASAIADGLNKYVKQQTRKPQWGDTLFVHYKVQKGDTLSQIAASYEVSTHTLKKLNGIKNANSLYVGKKLKIPVSDKLVAGI
ncbi:N-acetylmuramoyl-L-alanine amidase [Thiomicrorhabdus sp.]|uniref:N-acetylmuramoyl-L-alanine amidase n=1 Tax=Thiomicrorhabdus sp. TaxID=2039724 RepID=UPI002AA8615E|nr:N-acetylmuramoyl-L-alanine amidase [Thiomicrorhabdus sp.]